MANDYSTRPAPTDLDARRPAGMTYAVEAAPGRMTYTVDGFTPKTFGSLRRALKALASLVDYEPQFTAAARVVYITFN